MSKEQKQALYDRISAELTNFEECTYSKETALSIFYDLLVEVQSGWELITGDEQ